MGSASDSTTIRARSTRSPGSRRTCSRSPRMRPGRRGDRRRRPRQSSTCCVGRRRVARWPAPSSTVPVALGGRLLVERTSLRRELDDAASPADPDARPRTADHARSTARCSSARRRRPGRYATLVHAGDGETPHERRSRSRRAALPRGGGPTSSRAWRPTSGRASTPRPTSSPSARPRRHVHAFGTGHSHMLAEELFYRAGGLVRVKPILFEGLMLHAARRSRPPSSACPGSRPRSSTSTRSRAGDVLVVASNSGGNAVVTRARQPRAGARRARDRDRPAGPTPRARRARGRRPPNLQDSRTS